MHVADFFRLGDGSGGAPLAHVATECLDYASERRLDALMVLSFCDCVRQVALLRVPGGPAALSVAEFDGVVRALVDVRPSLQLAPMRLPTVAGDGAAAVDCARLFSQGAATASRKQIVPLWNACIEAATAAGVPADP